MYSLRIVEETRTSVDERFNQTIETFELGESYSLLKKGATNEFDILMEELYPNYAKNEITALLCGANGDKFFIEDKTDYRVSHYYIMTESGKTFEKIL